MEFNENIIEGEFSEKEDDFDGVSKWFISAIKGDLNFLRKNYEYYVGKRGEGSRTALMYAAESGNFDCVKFLSNFDSEIGQQDEDGNTAMMYAAKNGYTDCVELLIEDENNIINKNNKRAINLADENNFKECAGFLSLYEYEDGEEEYNGENDNTEKNLIREIKRIKNKINIMKKAGKDIDKLILLEKDLKNSQSN